MRFVVEDKAKKVGGEKLSFSFFFDNLSKRFVPYLEPPQRVQSLASARE